VLTIHDIQPLELPGNFPWLRVRYLRRAVPTAVTGAEVVVVPSSFVAQSLERVLGADPATIRVVPWPRPAPETTEPAERVMARLGITAPFALLPAITYPHKGHRTAVRALARLADRHPDLRLVLAGGAGPSEDAVAAEIEEHALTERVIRPGRLPTSSMVALIEAADVLLFPSTYEGFGIPPLEAMTMGTPVVACAAASLPEVIGDGGVLVPPDDDAQLAIEIHRLLAEPEHRDALVAAGREQADRFTPERTAELLLAAYRSAGDGR
jgi:glycosyltransferase involved in cell wall biosynthesis